MRLHGTRWALAMFFVLSASTVSLGVVGGKPVAAATYPGTGALVTRRFGSAVIVCTATVIAPRVLVTAAHCVTNFPVQPLDFTLATSALSTRGPASVPVRRAYVDPEYHLRRGAPLHDVALVELEAPLEGLSPERVLHPEDAVTVLRPGLHVQLVGYGITRADGWLWGEKNAAEATITRVGADEMTIGETGGPQNCTGDSGGPAFFVAADGTRWLIGVVSRSANDMTACVDGSIQTRLDAHAQWIVVTLRRIDQNFQRSKKK